MSPLELGPVHRQKTDPGERKVLAIAPVINFERGDSDDFLVVRAWRSDPADRRVATVNLAHMQPPSDGRYHLSEEVRSGEVIVRADSLGGALQEGARRFESELDTNPLWNTIRKRIRPQNPVS